MTTISGIPVYNGQPTEAGVDLMRAVHEAAGMGCWHEYNSSWDGDQWFISPDELCSKCGTRYYVWKGKNPAVLDRRNHNPAYLMSLDAYWVVWEKISNRNYAEQLMNVLGGEFVFVNRSFGECQVTFKYSQLFALATAQPHHHLEALARMVEVECACMGGLVGTPDTSDSQIVHRTKLCPTCSGTGKVTVLKQWEVSHADDKS